MIDELVTELAKARGARDDARANVADLDDDIREAFGTSLDAAHRALDAAKERVAMLETNARAAAVSEFERTGSKQPHKALSVGVYETMEYDEGKAIRYCMTHEISAALKLVKKKFDGVAKVLRPGFVTFGKEPRGRIATNLEEWR